MTTELMSVPAKDAAPTGVTEHISVDDHLIEPPDLWIKRLPKKFVDQAPRVERVAPRHDGWVFQDQTEPLFPTGSRRLDNRIAIENSFEEMRAGCYDPIARLEDMDADHVLAALCFPSMSGFSGTKFSACKDKDLGLACIQAYNDFLLEEWVPSAPGRYIPLILIPLWDTSLAVQEIERSIPKGARAISFSEDPYRQGFPSLHDTTGFWDPVFGLAEETQMPLCMHMGGSSEILAHREDRPWFTKHAMCYMNSELSLADWLTSDQFVRFPNLKICISEGGIGWIPHLLQHLDGMLDLYPDWGGRDVRERPSTYFRQNVYGCFIEDAVGTRLLDVIGVDNVMAETDYPHGDSTWPHSHERLLEQIGYLPYEDQYKIARGNAERVFNFKPSAIGHR
jgi:predicted TIM-barrel fold metal-dependent hydrolase